MTRIVVDMLVDTEGLKRLREIRNVQVHLASGDFESKRALPEDLIADAEILLCAQPPTNFDCMDRLRLIQVTSAGYQQLAGLGLEERGIRACNGLGEFDVPIAEWTIAMMINLSRNLRAMFRNQEAAQWIKEDCFQTEIRGRTLGIWGYGGIGRETARIAKSMGLTVYVLTMDGIKPRDNIYRVPGTGDPGGTLPDRVFQAAERDVFLRGLDYLLLAMPLTESNRAIVGQHELQQLPDHAFLLNPARGPLVEERALLQALRDGRIAGAALDTHYHYPMPPEHPLWAFPNVIMTPHISGSAASTHFTSRVWDIFFQNVQRHLSEEPLLNELRHKQLT